MSPILDMGTPGKVITKVRSDNKKFVEEIMTCNCH